MGQHSIVVGCNAANVGLEPVECPQGPAIREVLGDNDVARVEQRLQHHVDGLAGAVGQDNVVGRHVDRPVARELLRDELAERRIAGGVGVDGEVAAFFGDGLGQ